ncbi:DUF2971 domain-containing protein [Legionella bononiensis]|uniref:DUF2971 domain-containing protein n=1 Tax=Legionella bononiensis TaxID=2793102 RepID=A0ABS1W825_9GAMM|nr:DUF2971 domain-containing protein [Legionella bononiensis]MBL7479997.1 DUF2971 domain-containing protein [Legionella bononiensis]MBL7525489.1 DUF2971 domain-containing protein [Legionella bononiensis]MBL7561672.1 DUF2971 domain-containing protein [Legionella bononiensis]
MFIGSKMKGVLYHYTNHDSLYKIVNTKTLRATHVYYMNDSSEIKHAIDLFIKIVNQRKEQQNIQPLTLQLLEQLTEWVKYLIYNPHYIFSFSLSEHGNLLSQWRAYTHHGTGVSIGFDFSDLELYATKNNLLLIKCIYQSDEQERVLIEALDNILIQFDMDKSSINIAQGPKGQEYHVYLCKFTAQLLNVFIRIKNQSFHEECEWRLVSKYYESYKNKDIQFLSGKTTLIPYITFNIDSIRSDGYLFQQIFVGPSPNFELAFAAISSYLSNSGACNITVNSQQPFREI